MPLSERLKKYLQFTAEECIDCGKCMIPCRFLAEAGSPLSLALQALSSDEEAEAAAIRAYDCSLCGLCSAVCPVEAKPDRIFRELRKHAQAHNLFDLKKHSPLLTYESLGQHFPFKGEFIPERCTTAFFPGCTLPAMHPDATKRAYKILKRMDSRMGLILNCCSRPSEMLGLQDRYEESLSAMIQRIERKGIRRILTACPNCHMTFKDFGSRLKIVSVYEELRLAGFAPVPPTLREVTVHDPCVTRNETEIHEHVRDLLKFQGINIVEMKHNRRQTLCCGEGGATGLHNSEYATSWARKRVAEAQRTGVPMVTYCAGCVNSLGREHPATHVLDLLLVKRKEIPQPVTFPFNYLNRLLFRFGTR